MAATDARPLPKKNVAYRHYFAIRKTDGTLITSWTGQDSEVSLDGAAFADCANEATEIGSSGCGYLDLTAAEMNADAVLLKVTVTNTDALPYVIVLFPEEAGDLRVNITQIRDDTNAADNLKLACDAYSATRGLAGTALPDAAADAPGGLPVSDSGGLDLDAQLAKLVGTLGAGTHSPQSGDAYARLGPPDGMTISADLESIQNAVDNLSVLCSSISNQTSEIGVAGAGLAAIPWNADWDAQVQSEVADALTAFWTSPATLVDLIWDEPLAGHAAAGTAGADLSTAGGTGTNLTAIPWNADWDAQVQSEVADALTAFWTSPATLVDLIWDEPLAGHATAGTAGAALSAAGVAGDPWATALPGAYAPGAAGYIVGTQLDAAVSSRSSHTPSQVDTQLTSSHGTGSWQTGAGSTGSGARTITVTIDDGTDPVENARVRMSEGVSTYVGVTDANGEVTFNVDDATYSVAVTKAGYTFAGASLLVTADASPTYSLDALVVPLAVDPDRATGSIRVYDESGDPEVGASVTVQIQAGPGTAGHGYDTTPWTEESDAFGDVHFAGLVRGATYVIYRGTSTRRGKTFVVPDADTFDIEELLGSP